MIRDADAEWPSGFGARAVFAIQGVAEDEPFGSQWKGLDPVGAEELWRRVKSEDAPSTPAATLAAIAAAWEIKLKKFEGAAITPTDHLVVVGASAIAATIKAFAVGTALDWSEQVVVIASAPAERQLAAAATSILNRTRPTQLYTAAEAAPAMKRGTRLVASSDADKTDRARAEALIAG
ncbi:MAG: hypothetical protein M4D80_42130 [Myxococcota bacterium]|nr:hypothetical protein [Myxococcota bacterium]